MYFDSPSRVRVQEDEARRGGDLQVLMQTAGNSFRGDF